MNPTVQGISTILSLMFASASFAATFAVLILKRRD